MEQHARSQVLLNVASIEGLTVWIQNIAFWQQRQPYFLVYLPYASTVYLLSWLVTTFIHIFTTYNTPILHIFWSSNTTTPHMIQSLRHRRINIVKQYSLMCYPLSKIRSLSLINFITILKFTILIFKWTRNFIDENEISLDTKLNIENCIVASNWINDLPDDGLEKKTETCSCS